MTASVFDPAEKERALRAESPSSSWDTSQRFEAAPGDIPIVDIGAWRASGSADELAAIAGQPGRACETVGFYQLVGHGVSPALVAAMFDMVRRFHALPLEIKQRIAMDRPDWPVGGVGYLPMRNRKLPTCDRGNVNEAFIAKGQTGIGLDDNQWPAEDELAGFRETVEAYAVAVNDLAAALVRPVLDPVLLQRQRRCPRGPAAHVRWPRPPAEVPDDLVPPEPGGSAGRVAAATAAVGPT